MSKKNYYAIIPANVRYDKKLTPNAKLLYGEITALCNEKGFCWANNRYFAELYEVSNKSVSKWISQLSELGYVKTKLMYGNDSKQVKERRIYLAHTPMEEKFHTPRKKVPEGGEEKFHTPMEEKVKDNNTSFNNTVNTTPNSAGGGLSKITNMYQSNIGIITPRVGEMIKTISEEYPTDWILDAMDISITNNKRNLGYVEAILKRWETDGKDDGIGKTRENTKKWEVDAT